MEVPWLLKNAFLVFTSLIIDINFVASRTTSIRLLVSFFWFLRLILDFTALLCRKCYEVDCLYTMTAYLSISLYLPHVEIAPSFDFLNIPLRREVVASCPLYFKDRIEADFVRTDPWFCDKSRLFVQRLSILLRWSHQKYYSELKGHIWCHWTFWKSSEFFLTFSFSNIAWSCVPS